MHITFDFKSSVTCLDNALVIKQYEVRICEQTSDQVTIDLNGGKSSMYNALMIKQYE